MAFWAIIPAYVFILLPIHHLKVRPWLKKKKGCLSVDDELPYFAIPLMVLLFLVLLADGVLYLIGRIGLEQLKLTFAVVNPMVIGLGFLCLILPKVFYLRYKGGPVFTKPLSGNRAFFFITETLVVILLLAKFLEKWLLS